MEVKKIDKKQWQYLTIGIIVVLVASLALGAISIRKMQLPTFQISMPDWPRFSLIDWLSGGSGYPQTEFSAEVPINVIVEDDFAGGTIASAVVTVYEQGAEKSSETLTTGSDGSKTGSRDYASGDILDFYVSKSNAKYWILGVTIPFYDTEAKAAALTAHDVVLDFWTLGTYGVSVVDPNGESIANNGDLNKTTLGNTPTLTVTVRNTADDTGFRSSNDPIEAYMDQGMAFVKITGTGGENVVVTSPRWAQKDVATDRYWGGVIADDDLTRLLNADGTVKQNGVYSFDLVFDLTSYTGDAADLVIYVEAYTSWTYFDYYNAYGADAVQLATITINLVD